MSSILQENNLIDLLGTNCKVPDHSVLNLEMNIYIKPVLERPECDWEPEKSKYKLKERPPNLFSSEIANRAINNLIDEILNLRENQNNIDILYENLVTEFFSEMELLQLVRTQFSRNRPETCCANRSTL